MTHPQTNVGPCFGPIDLVIDGKAVLAHSFEAIMVDPLPVALYPERSEREGRYHEVDPSAYKTSITFHFVGLEAMLARRVLEKLLA